MPVLPYAYKEDSGIHNEWRYKKESHTIKYPMYKIALYTPGDILCRREF